VHPAAEDLIKKEIGRDSLPHQSPVQIGKGGQDRIDLTIYDQLTQLIDL
jgi:hypothetical protein